MSHGINHPHVRECQALAGQLGMVCRVLPTSQPRTIYLNPLDGFAEEIPDPPTRRTWRDMRTLLRELTQ